MSRSAHDHRAVRRLSVALATLLVTLLTLGTALSAAALQADGDAPSPARGHAQVIAHGVAELPDGSVAWRVSSAEAPTEGDEATEEALGFVLSADDALLLNDFGTGEQVRLADGEGAFVPVGAIQQQIALGDAAAPFYRIKLVPAEAADDPAGAELVFSGESFDSPGGNRDLDLVRDVLEEDEEVELDLGSESAPAVLLVTSGAVEIRAADESDADPTELSAGEGTDVTGELVISAAGEEGATFIAAVIGPEVPAIPAAEPTATGTPEADTASVTVVALVCPVGYAGDDFATECTEPAPDVAYLLVIPATEFSLEGTTDAEGTVVFTELGANTYTLTGGVPGEFATQTVVCADEDGPIPTNPTESEIPGGVFELEAGAEVTCTWYIVPEDMQGEPGADTDSDGLTDDEEAELGTDPNVADTDVDRLSDGFEVREFGTNPLAADSDEDGLGDGDELEVYRTDPLDVDTDDDGVDDPTEIDAGTDPTDPNDV